MKPKNLEVFGKVWLGLLVACIVGLAAYGLKVMIGSPLLDPLLVAMLAGIVVRSTIGYRDSLAPGFKISPLLFIPVGVIFYGAVKLNFVKFAKVDIGLIILLIIVMLVYFAVILLLGKLLKQKNEITYLTATGSAICGASAIAITSQAVEAEPDDVSISLTSVFIVASFGLFILFPFVINLFDVDDRVYALLSGMTLQFTGFVKAAGGGLSKELYSLAISVKAVRYLGLFIAIPLFATLARKKLHFPWFLWVFLGSGFLFSFAPAVAKLLNPFFKPAQVILWSIAMSAIGLGVDIKTLLSDNGFKALIMAFVGFAAAIVCFCLGIIIIG